MKYLLNNEIDILFLDIDMPIMNDFDLLRNIDNRVLCTIIVTSHSEFALEGFELKAFYYIIKPLNRDIFNVCVYRLKEYLEKKFKAQLSDCSFRQDSIMIKECYYYAPIQPYEVVYLESLKDYTKILLLNKKSAIVYVNLRAILTNKNLMTLLEYKKVIQYNRIQMIRANEIKLVNNILLPIGKSYKKNLMDSLA